MPSFMRPAHGPAAPDSRAPGRVGLPRRGDKLYGPDERLLARAADDELTAEDLQKLELPRHALHAHCYRIPHAITGELLTVSAPLASDLQSFWDALPR